MPTVVIGSARDIVEHCAVPRFLFVDFPLGNPCGKPWDRAMQRRIVTQGLGLLETATAPRTTLCSQERWGDDGWRDRYMAVTDDNRADLARQGEALRQQRAVRERRDA
ncbi:MAG TPA: hypothetical protein VLA56_19300 [Pseudomonadales bacterium]|nr:hypothetical protein [Pseudomonadales bacterium]